jgi:hypothetical protein
MSKILNIARAWIATPVVLAPPLVTHQRTQREAARTACPLLQAVKDFLFSLFYSTHLRPDNVILFGEVGATMTLFYFQDCAHCGTPRPLRNASRQMNARNVVRRRRAVFYTLLST